MVDDPGDSLSPELRRYVDAQDGDDGGDGRSPSTAWKTLGKIANQKENLSPGTHVLFRRGQIWTGKLDFENVHGQNGNRLV